MCLLLWPPAASLLHLSQAFQWRWTESDSCFSALTLCWPDLEMTERTRQPTRGYYILYFYDHCSDYTYRAALGAEPVTVGFYGKTKPIKLVKSDLSVSIETKSLFNGHRPALYAAVRLKGSSYSDYNYGLITDEEQTNEKWFFSNVCGGMSTLTSKHSKSDKLQEEMNVLEWL